MNTVVREPDGTVSTIPNCDRCGQPAPLGRFVEVADGVQAVLCLGCTTALDVPPYCCAECAYYDAEERRLKPAG